MQRHGTTPRLRPVRSLALALTLLAAVAAAPARAEGQLVPAERAVKLFLAVCGATAPRDFAGAQKVMAKYGITAKQPTGTVFSKTEDLSFKIMDGPGFGKTCSMVFASGDKAATVQAAVPKVGPFRDTAFGLAALTPDRHLVIYQKSRAGGRTYFNLRLFSDRG